MKNIASFFVAATLITAGLHASEEQKNDNPVAMKEISMNSEEKTQEGALLSSQEKEEKPTICIEPKKNEDTLAGCAGGCGGTKEDEEEATV